jgi:hypothetical protein
MNEDYFLACRVWAIVAWVLTAILLIAGWLLVEIPDASPDLGFMCAATGLAMSAAAATLHIRSFMVRVCSLIRAANSPDRNLDGQGLRPVG